MTNKDTNNGMCNKGTEYNNDTMNNGMCNKGTEYNNDTMNNGMYNKGTEYNNGTMNNGMYNKGTEYNNGTMNNGMCNKGTEYNNDTMNNGMYNKGTEYNNDIMNNDMYNQNTEYGKGNQVSDTEILNNNGYRYDTDGNLYGTNDSYQDPYQTLYDLKQTLGPLPEVIDEGNTMEVTEVQDINGNTITVANTFTSLYDKSQDEIDAEFKQWQKTYKDVTTSAIMAPMATWLLKAIAGAAAKKFLGEFLNKLFPQSPQLTMDQILDAVNEIINKRLNTDNYNRVKAELIGMQNQLAAFIEDMNNYTIALNDPKNAEKYDEIQLDREALIASTYGSLEQRLPQFSISGYEIVLLPLYAAAATSMLVFLRDVVGSQDWGLSPNFKNLYKNRMRDKVQEYSNYVIGKFQGEFNSYLSKRPRLNDLFIYRNFWVVEVLDLASTWSRMKYTGLNIAQSADTHFDGGKHSQSGSRTLTGLCYPIQVNKADWEWINSLITFPRTPTGDRTKRGIFTQGVSLDYSYSNTRVHGTYTYSFNNSIAPNSPYDFPLIQSPRGNPQGNVRNLSFQLPLTLGEPAVRQGWFNYYTTVSPTPNFYQETFETTVINNKFVIGDGRGDSRAIEFPERRISNILALPESGFTFGTKPLISNLSPYTDARFVTSSGTGGRPRLFTVFNRNLTTSISTINLTHPNAISISPRSFMNTTDDNNNNNRPVYGGELFANHGDSVVFPQGSYTNLHYKFNTTGSGPVNYDVYLRLGSSSATNAGVDIWMEGKYATRYFGNGMGTTGIRDKAATEWQDYKMFTGIPIATGTGTGERWCKIRIATPAAGTVQLLDIILIPSHFEVLY